MLGETRIGRGNLYGGGGGGGWSRWVRVEVVEKNIEGALT